MQNDMQMSTYGSIWKPEVEFQNGVRPCAKPEEVLSQKFRRGLKYFIKIWYANKFPPP